MSCKRIAGSSLLLLLLMSNTFSCNETNELDDHNYRHNNNKEGSLPAPSPSPETSEMSSNLTLVKYAANFLLKIRSQHRCRTPRPRLVPVKKFYPSTSKSYMPRCVFLHKCDDESGCCSNEYSQCVPRKQKTVSFYFYVVNSKANKFEDIELLEFVNDTLCECREINSRPRTEENPIYLPVEKHGSVDKDEPLRNSAKKETLCEKIKCPNPFHSRPVTIQAPHTCRCDCLSHDQRCLKIKHGMDSLDLLEMRCVQTDECLEPTCFYGREGHFDRRKGRCPGKRLRYKHRHRHAFKRD